MRTIAIAWALVVVVVMQGTAGAQPGQTPIAPEPSPDPSPYPPPPSGYPPPPSTPYPQPAPGGYAPPPYNYVPVQLTAEDQALLAEGEITDGQHVGGAVAGLFFGFGIGQAVQGRWSDTGWIFTLGEAASITAMVIGAVKSFDCIDSNDTIGGSSSGCSNASGSGLLIGGFVGFMVFRVWEVVDAFGGPPKHNRRVRELKMRLGIPQPIYSQRLTPYVNKARDGGGVAGLSLRF
ncbi:MAG: hypothetical protein ABI867_45585 [Kofleriaceae bacterium]